MNLRWSLAIVLIVLLALGLVLNDDQRNTTSTSYGTVPSGTSALFALLIQLDLTRGRSFSRADGLPAEATVWWIAPDELCRGVGEGDSSGPVSDFWESMDWASRGGTSVVWLPEAALPCLESMEIAGSPAPMRPRDYKRDDDDADQEQRDEPSDRKAWSTVEGTLHPAARSLPAMPIAFFAATDGFEKLSSDTSGRAWVVSREVGRGRVVFVATSTPLTNRWLDHGDVALFAVDLALTLGSPFIDERGHGMQPPQNAILYLINSAALPAFAGAVLVALLAFWWGHAPRAPVITGSDLPPPPTLDGFVSSIAALYATTRDNSHVLRAYQEFALDQLRRSFRFPADVPTQRVFDRIVATQKATPDDLRLLQQIPSCRHRSELVQAVDRIDTLIAQVLK